MGENLSVIPPATQQSELKGEQVNKALLGHLAISVLPDLVDLAKDSPHKCNLGRTLLTRGRESLARGALEEASAVRDAVYQFTHRDTGAQAALQEEIDDYNDALSAAQRREIPNSLPFDTWARGYPHLPPEYKIEPEIQLVCIDELIARTQEPGEVTAKIALTKACFSLLQNLHRDFTYYDEANKVSRGWSDEAMRHNFYNRANISLQEAFNLLRQAGLFPQPWSADSLNADTAWAITLQRAIISFAFNTVSQDTCWGESELDEQTKDECRQLLAIDLELNDDIDHPGDYDALIGQQRSFNSTTDTEADKIIQELHTRHPAKIWRDGQVAAALQEQRAAVRGGLFDGLRITDEVGKTTEALARGMDNFDTHAQTMVQEGLASGVTRNTYAEQLALTPTLRQYLARLDTEGLKAWGQVREFNPEEGIETNLLRLIAMMRQGWVSTRALALEVQESIGAASDMFAYNIMQTAQQIKQKRLEGILRTLGVEGAVPVNQYELSFDRDRNKLREMMSAAAARHPNLRLSSCRQAMNGEQADWETEEIPEFREVALHELAALSRLKDSLQEVIRPDDAHGHPLLTLKSASGGMMLASCQSAAELFLSCGRMLSERGSGNESLSPESSRFLLGTVTKTAENRNSPPDVHHMVVVFALPAALEGGVRYGLIDPNTKKITLLRSDGIRVEPLRSEVDDQTLKGRGAKLVIDQTKTLAFDGQNIRPTEFAPAPAEVLIHFDEAMQRTSNLVTADRLASFQKSSLAREVAPESPHMNAAIITNWAHVRRQEILIGEDVATISDNEALIALGVLAKDFYRFFSNKARWLLNGKYNPTSQLEFYADCYALATQNQRWEIAYFLERDASRILTKNQADIPSLHRGAFQTVFGEADQGKVISEWGRNFANLDPEQLEQKLDQVREALKTFDEVYSDGEIDQIIKTLRLEAPKDIPTSGFKPTIGENALRATVDTAQSVKASRDGAAENVLLRRLDEATQATARSILGEQGGGLALSGVQNEYLAQGLRVPLQLREDLRIALQKEGGGRLVAMIEQAQMDLAPAIPAITGRASLLELVG